MVVMNVALRLPPIAPHLLSSISTLTDRSSIDLLGDCHLQSHQACAQSVQSLDVLESLFFRRFLDQGGLEKFPVLGLQTVATIWRRNLGPPTPLSSSAQEEKDAKSKQEEEKKKVDKATGRSLWVSGLSSTTRATDLKQLFSKQGKVVSAKVVTNAKVPGHKCYGFVTMTSPEDAVKCIQVFHKTELHGRMISVELTKADPGPAL
ncbi:unnamed protein product, partial [Cyprideis torosa]